MAYFLAFVAAFQLMLDCKLFGVPDNINSIILTVSMCFFMWLFNLIARHFYISPIKKRVRRNPPKFYTVGSMPVEEDTEWPMIEL